MASDSFAGIAPASVPGFVAAELAGAALALAVDGLWFSSTARRPAAPAPAAPEPATGRN